MILQPDQLTDLVPPKAEKESLILHGLIYGRLLRIVAASHLESFVGPLGKKDFKKNLLFFLLAFVQLHLLPTKTNHLELMTKQPNWLNTDKNCCAVNFFYLQESAH